MQKNKLRKKSPTPPPPNIEDKRVNEENIKAVMFCETENFTRAQGQNPTQLNPQPQPVLDSPKDNKDDTTQWIITPIDNKDINETIIMDDIQCDFEQEMQQIYQNAENRELDEHINIIDQHQGIESTATLVKKSPENKDSTETHQHTKEHQINISSEQQPQQEQPEQHSTDNQPGKLKKFRSQQPPFIVSNSKIATLTGILVKILALNNFIFKNLAHNKIAVYVKSYNDFKLTFENLKLNNIDFHTKTPNQDRLYSWLLRGIAGDYNVEDILAELEKEKLKNVKIKEVKKINIK